MLNPHISIIVPTYNNEKTLQSLINRLDISLKKNNIRYELIFVDDYSTDETRAIISDLSSNKSFVSRLFLKEGQSGYVQSILEGLHYAKYSIIATITPGLEYQPESLSEMIKLIKDNKSDFVIGRREYLTSFFRKLLDKTFSYWFIKVLHKLDFDIHSKLKVFKKEIIDRTFTDLQSDSFELQLIAKAKHAGYRITQLPVTYNKTLSTPASIWRFLVTGIVAIWVAIKLRLVDFPIVPFSKKLTKEKGKGFHVNGIEFIHHTDLNHSESALFRFSKKQIAVMIGLIVALALSFYLSWYVTIQVFVAVLTVLYFLDLLFNMFLIFRSFVNTSEIVVDQETLSSHASYNWPTYTILCPLYKEWQVIPQFTKAMTDLDYPEDRLQIMLLLEADDTVTIAKVKDSNLPNYFQAVVVPPSQPKTKPKACNYGLGFATGEFIVIYDAEDVPDPYQLKKAIIAFEKLGPKTICVQAKLNFYNPKQNLLTRVFTAEYSLWFDLVLTGLQSIEGPIPLGGTSNHFRSTYLKEINGWDAFNVTEDCDLGMRLVKKGYHTAIIDSTTLEEANSDLFNWFRQRSRWIKGYIQTYFVHMRRPSEFIRDWRHPHLVTFQLVIGGKVLSLFINPMMWIITIIYFIDKATVAPYVEPFFPAPIFYMAVISIIFGNFFYLYYYMIGCAKRGYDDIIKYVFLVPFYWLTMSLAAWKALYEIIVKPHFWQKTIHGLHLKNQQHVNSVKNNIGATFSEGVSK